MSHQRPKFSRRRVKPGKKFSAAKAPKRKTRAPVRAKAKVQMARKSGKVVLAKTREASSRVPAAAVVESTVLAPSVVETVFSSSTIESTAPVTTQPEVVDKQTLPEITMPVVAPRSRSVVDRLSPESRQLILWAGVGTTMVVIVVGWFMATLSPTVKPSTITQDPALTAANEQFFNLFSKVNQRLDSFNLPASTPAPAAPSNQPAPSVSPTTPTALTPAQIQLLKQKVLGAEATAPTTPANHGQ